MDNRLTLGKVHIVEWLNPEDGPTGEKLLKDLQPLGRGSNPRVEVDFHRIETAGELLGLLLAFTEEYRSERRTPLLHLETHGNHGGIGARGQCVAWRDLADVLAPLNHITGVNLVVILAACWGFHGVQMLRPSYGPAPFRGLIAPNRELGEAEVLDACLTFYRTIFARLNADEAITAMNGAVDPQHETFWHISAETAFMLAFQDYMEGDGSPEGATVRADEFATRRAARIAVERCVPVPPKEVEQWRLDARAFLENHDLRFAMERRKFFYIEEFPENDARFEFTLDDCRRATETERQLVTAGDPGRNSPG